MSVHPLLLRAKAIAELYAVRRSRRGFNVWRFFGWGAEVCGWRIVARDFRTRADARAYVLNRLGLSEEKPPAQLPPLPPPTVIWGPLFP